MKEIEDILSAYHENMFARNGQTVDVLALYNALSDKSITDEQGKNLYHIAATFADSEAIDLLAEAGVKPRPDDSDNTALHDLTKSPLTNDITNYEKKYDAIYDTVKKLVALKVNPKKKNESGDIAYLKAGIGCMYPFIAALADSGLKMDATGNEGKNILHIICSQLANRKSVKGYLDAAYKTIKILIDSGSIDPEDKDIFSTTPLTYAQRSGVKEIAALLSGDENDAKTAGMTLTQAVLQKDIEAVEAILQSGADIDEISDQYQKTALMLACEYPSLEIVQLLIKSGADVNFTSGANGCTAAFYLINNAVSNLGKGVKGGVQDPKIIKKILRTLIDAGLNVDNAVDNNGNTALHVICLATYLADLNNSLAEELVDAGCNVNQANLDGITPLMIFAQQGAEQQHNIAELLLDNEADGSLVDKNSFTALMYAAGNGNSMSAKKIVELMLDNGDVAISKTNNKGETAIDIAVKNNNEAVVKLLLSRM